MRLPRWAPRFSGLATRWRHPAARAARSGPPALLCPGPAFDAGEPGREPSGDKVSDPSSAVRVLLVDDHVLVRSGVRTLLEAKHAFHIVGEAREGIEALDLIAHTSPRVAVMDLIMPGLGGLETTRQIRERHPGTDVVILSMYCDEEQVQLALLAGARGFVQKGAEVERLAEAIRRVAEGQLDFGDVITEERLQAMLAQPPAPSPYDSLTRREREVLQLAAWGYTSERIAESLAVSPRTVESHRSHLLRKLGLRNQVELVFFAIRHGVLMPDAAEALRARDRMTH
jgi:DNA-binding NarL/FixJ family response regulator